MSYLVLARKYRPRTFGEVTGQDSVTQTLRGAIAEDRVGHAYLLTGPRGTGKTTTARIFAKALNCEKGPAQDPCGECERCLAADAGSEIDIVEIDAASHTGVDNIRELRGQAAYAPIRARFKVYIIDEVHMLSKAAFNALLKTLEEPPPHVKFLFATTELNKVPDTILSRCQVLRLTALDEATITERLREVFEREEVRPEEGVAESLARRARGGMRDALSLADQLLALVGEAPTLEDVRRLSAGADREAIEALAVALTAGDRAGVLSLLPASQGSEIDLLEALLDHLRASMLCLLCGVDNPQVDATPEARERMAERVRELGAERLELWLEELLATRERMRLLPTQARLSLELSLLALCRREATVPIEEIAGRLLSLEKRLGGAPSSAEPPPAPAASAPAPAAAPAAVTPQRAPASPPARRAERAPSARSLRSNANETWSRFLTELEGQSPSLGDLYRRRGTLMQIDEERAVVKLERLNDKDRALVFSPRNEKRCAEVLSKLLGSPTAFEIQDAAGMRPGSQDPFTQEVADLFGGRIED